MGEIFRIQLSFGQLRENLLPEWLGDWLAEQTIMTKSVKGRPGLDAHHLPWIHWILDGWGRGEWTVNNTFVVVSLALHGMGEPRIDLLNPKPRIHLLTWRWGHSQGCCCPTHTERVLCASAVGQVASPSPSIPLPIYASPFGPGRVRPGHNLKSVCWRMSMKSNEREVAVEWRSARQQPRVLTELAESNWPASFTSIPPSIAKNISINYK